MPPGSKAFIWYNGVCVCVHLCVHPVAVFEQSNFPLVSLEKPLCCPCFLLKPGSGRLHELTGKLRSEH